ncbi:AAA family ATPase [Marinagarivorans algicola]|uniref:AAA family ATPase n=1 Tax=Marinagarivorans algicola TaxID=1513270 RepID=UPI0009EB6DD3|nr:AAA family ATPase [Marinagarivorans algicola]
MTALAQTGINALKEQLASVFTGNDNVLDNIIIALLCQGHILLEDAPGTGKTTLAKALSKSVALSFKRIQCTPDLMPSDILGGNIYQPQSQDFKFIPGPIFTNLLLVDEINRAAPRTQSAFLEAMAEGTITIDRKTAHLPKPFLVIATQNPVEFAGTFPLPEAQLDRFFMRLSLGRPSTEQALAILQNHNNSQQIQPVEALKTLITKEHLMEWQHTSQKTTIDTQVQEYIVAIIEASHHHKGIRLGASPRAAIALMHAAKAYAFIHGDGFVTPHHIQSIAPAVLAHRLILSHQNTAENARHIMSQLLQQVPVPGVAQTNHNPSHAAQAQPIPPTQKQSTVTAPVASTPSSAQPAHVSIHATQVPAQAYPSTPKIPLSTFTQAAPPKQPDGETAPHEGKGIEAFFSKRKEPTGVKKPRIQKSIPNE